MNKFNSLGSNFSLSSAVNRLCSIGGATKQQVLKRELASHYGGTAMLTYKGREALQLALKQANLPAGSAVAINAYTCFVVVDAVKKAGYIPVFVDVATSTLHYDSEQLLMCIKATGTQNNLKAVVVQNTLGAPCNISAIEDMCKQYNLVLIEDLAHSIGTVYTDGREAGTVGDFVMLSFSQDKTLDVVAGGALVDRRGEQPGNSAMPNDAEDLAPVQPVHMVQRLKNRWYPSLTYFVRLTFALGVGKVALTVFKKITLLSRPMDYVGEGMHAFDTAGAQLLWQRWMTRQVEYAHRKSIASIYDAQLPASVKLKNKLYGDPVMVRYPLFVPDRQEAIRALERAGQYISDTWYDVPVGPKAYFKMSGMDVTRYPNAQYAAKHILNLPTHSNITEADARFICATMNKWLTTLPNK